MKVDKGFALSKEEAEKNMRANMNQYKTSLSKNLVFASSQPRNDDGEGGLELDLRSTNSKPTKIQAPSVPQSDF